MKHFKILSFQLSIIILTIYHMRDIYARRLLKYFRCSVQKIIYFDLFRNPQCVLLIHNLNY